MHYSPLSPDSPSGGWWDLKICSSFCRWRSLMCSSRRMQLSELEINLKRWSLRCLLIFLTPCIVVVLVCLHCCHPDLPVNGYVAKQFVQTCFGVLNFAWPLLRLGKRSGGQSTAHVCQPRHQALVNSWKSTSPIWMVVDGAGCYHVLSCLLLCTTLTSCSRSQTYLCCIVERINLTPVRRRLSLTPEGLGQNILDGAELTSVINAWSRKVSPLPMFHL